MIDLGTLLDTAQTVHAMVAGTAAAINPVPLLYTGLAATYGAAAQAAAANDHQALTRCYVTSAITHALIGVCHHLHI